MRIFVVSPHRDDAAFSLGLAVDAWLSAGHQVQVLNCFTQSQYAPFSDVESLHANDRTSFVSAVRKREDVAWGKLAGSRLQFHDLDLLDAPLRLGCSVDEVQTVEIRAGDRAQARVAGALAKLVRTSSQSGVALAVPLAVGKHIDHRIVHAAALETLRQELPVAFYEDLPYAARAGGAEEIETLVDGTGFDLHPGFAAPSAVELGDALGRKRKIAECYDSQIDSDVVQSIASFGERYGGRERLWINAAWQATGLSTV